MKEPKDLEASELTNKPDKTNESLYLVDTGPVKRNIALRTDRYVSPAQSWKKADKMGSIFSPVAPTQNHQGKVISRLPKDKDHKNFHDRIIGTI
jgi:hypothetical protein